MDMTTKIEAISSWWTCLCMHMILIRLCKLKRHSNLHMDSHAFLLKEKLHLSVRWENTNIIDQIYVTVGFFSATCTIWCLWVSILSIFWKMGIWQDRSSMHCILLNGSDTDNTSVKVALDRCKYGCWQMVDNWIQVLPSSIWLLPGCPSMAHLGKNAPGLFLSPAPLCQVHGDTLAR